jgi:hypothetical protein
MGISMVGWWGCGSCGQKVSNGHMGPCLFCGGRIRRIVPTEAVVDIGLTPGPYRMARNPDTARPHARHPRRMTAMPFAITPGLR